MLDSFVKLGKLSRGHEAIAVNVLRKDRALCENDSVRQTSNGVVNVFAFLCQELGFVILDTEGMVLETPSQGNIAFHVVATKIFATFWNLVVGGGC